MRQKPCQLGVNRGVGNVFRTVCDNKQFSMNLQKSGNLPMTICVQKAQLEIGKLKDWQLDSRAVMAEQQSNC